MCSIDSSQVIVRAATEKDFDAANEIYRRINFLPSPSKDFVVIAEIGDRLAGLGRLSPIDEYTGELGGIYVGEEFRKKGIAAAVVDFLVASSPYNHLFCIPFENLVPFYRRYGFVEVAPGISIPDSVTDKLNWCRTTYPSPVALLMRGSAK